MAKRGVQRDPELLAHQEWLGYLQPVGLVVAPAAMQDAGWVVTRSGSELIERQERYRESLEALGSDEEAEAEDRELGFSSIETLLVDHLGWSCDQVQSDPNLIEGHTRELPELGETLQPSAVVPAAIGDGAQLLVHELPLLTPLDQKVTGGEHLWRASAQERFERLLRETGVEAGLLFNGSQLRLVVAPKGESSGHITFSLKDLAAVSGRLMFSGLDLLLGQSHVFLDPDGYRLADVLRKSRSFQAVVSNALADQVLSALWDLLRGFQQADELTQRQGGLLLGDLAEDDPKQLYGGLITVLMRLVFLLYAEDNALLPKDAVYEQNYKVSGVFERLEQDAAEFPDTMEQRYGAWAGLMSLCQLVFAGGGATVDYLPARKGQLFDPAVYPWLETPWISDGVVHEVLSNLLVVKGERISYRALDVEQIGSVYEGIMGYAVRRIPGRCIGLKSKPQGAKKQLTTAVDLDALLTLPGGKRKAWLEEQAGTTLPPKSANALKAANSEAELLEALEPRIDRELFDGPQAAGSLVFQPTEERRRSGSHYTPRALTRPIVEEALRPWLERRGGKPTVAQILALKICDPAMGSGAFLVECCRYLAELLEQAWARERLPEALLPGGSAYGEEPLIYARRLIAQSCLYGVDKNPFAVNLARLSLWLVSLSKEAPFTFVDHALKCGDSLVGMERSEIEKALKGASLQRELQIAYLDEVRQQEARSFALFHADSRSDADDDQKRQALDDLNASTAYLRTVGDLLVAAFFNGKKPTDREELRKLYLEATLQHSSSSALEDELAEPLRRLREGEKGIQPLHWQLAFPDVFGRDQPGYDALIGNPPFLGGSKIMSALGIRFPEYLRLVFQDSNGKGVDLCAFFLRKCAELIRPHGTISLVGTKRISQGDTRSAGLRWLATNGYSIYSAQPSLRWPGMASVIVSIIHLYSSKQIQPSLPAVLKGKEVEGINSHLMPTPYEFEPHKLLQNSGLCFAGVKIYGEGFIFADKEELVKDGYAGGPGRLAEILRQNPRSAEVIRDYIGGKEISQHPRHNSFRKVINFGDLSIEHVKERYPELLSIVEETVKPVRDALNNDYKLNARRKEHWWQFAGSASRLYSEIRHHDFVFAMPVTTTYIAIAKMPVSTIYSFKAIVFSARYGMADFGLLQSRVHAEWALRLCLSQGAGDSPVYKPQDCYETLAKPEAILSQTDSLVIAETAIRYEDHRRRAMVERDAGLTTIYNLFNNPGCSDNDIVRLRKLQEDLDAIILGSYGWHDIDPSPGFFLDDVESLLDDELLEDLSPVLSEAAELPLDMASASAVDALVASRNHRANCSWRYRWPDAVRDDVLSRLLALNAERYAEEKVSGLKARTHGIKSARNTQASKAPHRNGGSSKASAEHIQTDLHL